MTVLHASGRWRQADKHAVHSAPGSSTTFSGAANFFGAHLIETFRADEGRVMDKSMWIAASALTAWLMVGAAAMM